MTSTNRRSQLEEQGRSARAAFSISKSPPESDSAGKRNRGCRVAFASLGGFAGGIQGAGARGAPCFPAALLGMDSLLPLRSEEAALNG